MSRVDDERLRFFLEHETLIQEWAGLASLARTYLFDFLVGLVPTFEQLAIRLGDDVRVLANVEGTSSPEILLVREGWFSAGSAPSLRAGVGVAWTKSDATFAGASRPYTGIEVALSQPGGDELRECIKGSARGQGLTAGYATGQWWLAWRLVDVPAGAYWDDLSAYGDAVVAAVREDWQRFAPVVDACIGAVGNPSGNLDGA